MKAILINGKTATVSTSHPLPKLRDTYVSPECRESLTIISTDHLDLGQSRLNRPESNRLEAHLARNGCSQWHQRM